MDPDVNVHGVLNVMRHVLPAMVVAHTAAPKKTKAGYVDKVDRTTFSTSIRLVCTPVYFIRNLRITQARAGG